MKLEKYDKLKMQLVISGLITIIGILLLIYMIKVEDEPGLIPLLLITIGIGWYFITRTKIRAKTI